MIREFARVGEENFSDNCKNKSLLIFSLKKCKQQALNQFEAKNKNQSIKPFINIESSSNQKIRKRKETHSYFEEGSALLKVGWCSQEKGKFFMDNVLAMGPFYMVLETGRRLFGFIYAHNITHFIVANF